MGRFEELDELFGAHPDTPLATIYFAGPVNAGRFLYYHRNNMNEVALESCVQLAWTTWDTPMSMLDTTRWVELFRQAGYIGDVPAPTEPMTIFRGGIGLESAQGMSWTADIEIAKWYAETHRATLIAERSNAFLTVFEATVPPEGVLASFFEVMIADEDFPEKEVVVDPAFLTNVKLIERSPTGAEMADSAGVPEHNG